MIAGLNASIIEYNMTNGYETVVPSIVWIQSSQLVFIKS